jgi:hypothetical protein
MVFASILAGHLPVSWMIVTAWPCYAFPNCKRGTPSPAPNQPERNNMTVKFWRDDCDDKVFFVELANPPVNAINLAVRQGLHDAMLGNSGRNRS